MPSCNVEHITDYGLVPCDLEPLIEAVQSMDASEWSYRLDPESYKTCVVRETQPSFPKKIVDSILEQAGTPHFGAGYWNRLVLSCIPRGEEILPHRDDFGATVRDASFHCHIPLITSPDVVMGFP